MHVLQDFVIACFQIDDHYDPDIADNTITTMESQAAISISIGIWLCSCSMETFISVIFFAEFLV